MTERFGPYELGALLGRGGMGEVRRARDTRKNRGEVALKRLPAGLAADGDFQRRFLREAEQTARLRNAHVIPIHDYGEIDGQPYLDMRLVDGADLAMRLREHGPLAPERAVGITTQVAGALDAAHREGLAHRDVKPQNVLLARPTSLDGEPSDFVYLIDFGIAANLLTSRRSSSVVSGTAAYMAPERFTAGGDHRVDVYSLGCLLHEALVGRPPFDGDFMQLMWAHVHEPPPRLSAARPELPAALDAVVATAMAKDPAGRFASAGALAAAAREAVGAPGPRTVPAARSSAPSSASTVVPMSPRPVLDELPADARARARRRRWITVGVVTAVVVAAIIATVVLVGGGASSSRPVGPRAATIPATVTRVPGAEGAEEVVVTPDGTTAYVVTHDTGGPSAVTVVDLARRTVVASVPLVGPTEGPDLYAGLELAPDGRHVYALTATNAGGNRLTPGTLWVIDTADNRLAASMDAGDLPLGLTVSPDGRFAYVLGFGHLTVVDTGARSITATVAIPDTAYGIAASPDRSRLYVVGYGLTTIDARSTAVLGTVVLPQGGPEAAVAVAPDGRRVYATSGGGVAVLDAATGAITSTIALDDPVKTMVLDPEGRRLFAADDRSITEIDAATGTVTGVVRQTGVYNGGSPLSAVDFAAAPGGRRLYVPTGAALTTVDLT